MALPIISADQRLAEPRCAKIVLVGVPGAGKTSQLKTLPEDSTLFVDLEAGGARQASCRLFLLADHQMDLLLDQDFAHRSVCGARARRGQLGCPQGKPVDSRLRRYPS